MSLMTLGAATVSLQAYDCSFDCVVHTSYRLQLDDTELDVCTQYFLTLTLHRMTLDVAIFKSLSAFNAIASELGLSMDNFVVTMVSTYETEAFGLFSSSGQCPPHDMQLTSHTVQHLGGCSIFCSSHISTIITNCSRCSYMIIGSTQAGFTHTFDTQTFCPARMRIILVCSGCGWELWQSS